jgi:hypothetical protein
MFSGPIKRLEAAINSAKAAVSMHDFTRNLYFQGPPSQSSGQRDLWEPVRNAGLDRLTWQIYDYCAAITRLYTAYSIFVEDIALTYLRILPSLYTSYPSLPACVRMQHRIGAAQILLKLGKAGPFRSLHESEIVRVVSNAVGGREPYSFLERAFFVENQRQNYRLDALARLLGSLGIRNLGTRISTHQAMKDFLERKRGGSGTFESELARFVQLRNEAAHTEVEEVIAGEELQALADFVWALCTALAEIVTTEVVTRRVALGQIASIGTVAEVYRNGFVAVIRANPSRLRVGDQVAIISKKKLLLSRLTSIQDFGKDVEAIDATEGQEVGLGLDRKCAVGYTLAKVLLPAEHQVNITELPEVGGGEGDAAEAESETDGPLGDSAP